MSVLGKLFPIPYTSISKFSNYLSHYNINIDKLTQITITFIWKYNI